MLQECVLGPGVGSAGVVGRGAAGVSPAPVPCRVVFAQRVLEGVLGIFSSFFPFSPSLHHRQNIRPLSALGEGGGQLGCLEELGPCSAPTGCCWARGGRAGEWGCWDRPRSLHWWALAGAGLGGVSRGSGDRQPPSSRAPRAGSSPPGRCCGGSQDPGWAGALCPVSHWFSPCLDYFASFMVTSPGICPGKGAGSLGTCSTLWGVAPTPNQTKGLAQKGVLQTFPWDFICSLCAFTSRDDPPGAWSPGPPFSSGVAGGGAQGCLV